MKGRFLGDCRAPRVAFPSDGCRLGEFRDTRKRGAQAALTIIEVVISLGVLALFCLSSTIALNMFDTSAAKNRNTEAARAAVNDYVNYLLNDSTAAPTVTSAGTDIDGDGIPDGVICTAIGSRSVPTSTGATGVVPLVVTRTAAAASVVTGTLYWRVQAVGTAFGFNANTDLMQVNFLMSYKFRGRTYFYKALTFKASS